MSGIADIWCIMRKKADRRSYMYEIENEVAFIERVKDNFKKVRKEKNMTQEQMWENRTTVSEWENKEKATLPSLVNLLKICNNLDVDIEYLLGLSDVQSKSNKAIADEIHTDEATVASMKQDPFYGRFANALAKFEILSDLKSSIKTTAMAEMCNSATEANLTSRLLKRLSIIYESYIYETFPSDISAESFRKCLEDELGNEIERDRERFLSINFKDEGVMNLKNSTDKIDTTSILDLIADFSFDYFRTRDIIEKQNERLNRKFVELAQSVIDEEKAYYTENIRKNIASGRLRD